MEKNQAHFVKASCEVAVMESIEGKPSRRKKQDFWERGGSSQSQFSKNLFSVQKSVELISDQFDHLKVIGFRVSIVKF